MEAGLPLFSRLTGSKATAFPRTRSQRSLNLMGPLVNPARSSRTQLQIT